MRQFKAPLSLPAPTSALVNADGTATEEFRRVLEQITLQQGGQGGDALYDASMRFASQIEENAAKLEQAEVQAREFQARLNALSNDNASSIDDLRREINGLRGDIFQALSSLGDLARSGLVDDSLVATGAAINNKKIYYPNNVGYLASDLTVTTAETFVCEVEVSDVQTPHVFFFSGSQLVFDSTNAADAAGTALWQIKSNVVGGGAGNTGGLALARGTVTFAAAGPSVVVNDDEFPPTTSPFSEFTGNIYLKLTMRCISGCTEAYLLGDGTDSETLLRYTAFGNVEA